MGNLMNFFLPHRCLACHTIVGNVPGLCAHCWEKVSFLTHSLCHCCGVFCEQLSTETALCAKCLTKRPIYTQARAAFLYTDFSRSFILPLKHGDQTYIAKYMAPWLWRAGADFWPYVDAIVPTPLHWVRLFLRQYNQADLMAKHLSPLINKPILQALKRVRHTRPQGDLSHKQRYRNVARAFALADKCAVQDKRIVLLDDVLTSGATANACTHVLKKAGARDVFILTLARTALS